MRIKGDLLCLKNATQTTNKRKATASAVAFLLFMRLSAYLLLLLFPIKRANISNQQQKNKIYTTTYDHHIHRATFSHVTTKQRHRMRFKAF